MKQKGRKSTAKLSVVTPSSQARPLPPKDLNDAEQELWNRVTATKTADFFDDCVLPLLAEYCRLKTSVDLLAKSIDAYDPRWLDTDGGVVRYKGLADLRDKAQGRMIALARSMRLTNQSRYPPQTAATRSAPSKSNDRLWQRE